MSEISKSIFMKGLVHPIKIKIEAEKQNDGLWELKYEEWFSLEDKALLEEALATTKRAGEKAAKLLGGEISSEGNKLSFTFKGTIDQIANGLITEMLTLSSLGNITLRDMIVLAGLAIPELKKLEVADNRA